QGRARRGQGALQRPGEPGALRLDQLLRPGDRGHHSSIQSPCEVEDLVADSRTYQVPALGAGERLDHHLSAALADLSRARIKHLIEQGRVRVDGKLAKPARRLKGGERVEIEIPPPVSAKPQAEELPLEILYQDQDLAVIDKAAGMVVHPGAGNWQGTLVNALLFSLSDLAGIGGELRPGLVHRLDKGTSGCIVVAKNDFALASLQSQFQSGSGAE